MFRGPSTRCLLICHTPWLAVSFATALMYGASAAAQPQTNAENRLDGGSPEMTEDVTQGALRIVAPGGQVVECPLTHTDVRAEVSGFLARVRVTQTFKNPKDEKIEAVYVFPLPHQSAIDEMTMVIGERRIVGQIKRRDDAQRIYQQALAAGQTAALLEQERPNIFTQSVGNIPPGATVRVEISYVDVLKYDQGEYEFSFPMVVGPRFNPGTPSPPAPLNQELAGKALPGGAATTRVPDGDRINPPILRPGNRNGHDISLTIHLDAGVPVEGMTVASHQASIERTDTRRAVVKLNELDSVPNKDFVLRYDVTGEKPSMALLAHKIAAGNQNAARPGRDAGYFMLMVQPADDERLKKSPPREIVFLIDVSGSMSGEPTRKVIDTMQHMLKLCREGVDTVQVVTFASGADKLFAAPVPVNDENVGKALNFTNAIRAGGGTQMLEGVKLAMDQPVDPERVRIIVMLTDGYIGNEAEIIEHVGKRASDQLRFWCVGIGASPNMFLVDGVAKQGGGMGKQLNLNDDAELLATEVITRIQRAQLSNVELDWGGIDTFDTYPAKLPELWAGRPLVVFGRYRGADGKVAINVKGRVEGEAASWPLSVELPTAEPKNDVLAPTWARQKIEDLMQSSFYAGSPAVEEAVTALALDYRLMSQYTSFVAVDDSQPAAEGPVAPPRRMLVPVPLPAGTRWEGFFGPEGRDVGRDLDLADGRRQPSQFGRQLLREGLEEQSREVAARSFNPASPARLVPVAEAKSQSVSAAAPTNGPSFGFGGVAGGPGGFGGGGSGGRGGQQGQGGNGQRGGGRGRGSFGGQTSGLAAGVGGIAGGQNGNQLQQQSRNLQTLLQQNRSTQLTNQNRIVQNQAPVRLNPTLPTSGRGRIALDESETADAAAGRFGLAIADKPANETAAAAATWLVAPAPNSDPAAPVFVWEQTAAGPIVYDAIARSALEAGAKAAEAKDVAAAMREFERAIYFAEAQLIRQPVASDIAEKSLTELQRLRSEQIAGWKKAFPWLGARLDLVLRDVALDEVVRQLQVAARKSGGNDDALLEWNAESLADVAAANGGTRVHYLDLRGAELADALDWILLPARLSWRLEGDKLVVASSRRLPGESSWVYDVAEIALPRHSELGDPAKQVEYLAKAQQECDAVLAAVRERIGGNKENVQWFAPGQVLIVGDPAAHEKAQNFIAELTNPQIAANTPLHRQARERLAARKEAREKSVAAISQLRALIALDEFGWPLLAAAASGKLDLEALTEIEIAWKSLNREEAAKFADGLLLRTAWIVNEAARALPAERELGTFSATLATDTRELSKAAVAKVAEAGEQPLAVQLAAAYALLARRDDAEFADSAYRSFVASQATTTAWLTRAVVPALLGRGGNDVGKTLVEHIRSGGVSGEDAVVLTALACRRAGGEAWSVFRAEAQSLLARQPLAGDVVVLVGELSAGRLPLVLAAR